MTMTPSTTMQRRRFLLWLVVVVCCLSVVSAVSRWHPILIRMASHQLARPTRTSNAGWMLTTRGGSTATDSTEGDIEAETAPKEEDDEDDEDEENEGETNEENEDSQDPVSSILNEPARLLVQTNLGNVVLDHRIELTSKRSKTIGEIKKSISRLLPGRPPLLGLDLVYEGRTVQDEMLISELYDDDEDDEDDDADEENPESFKILTLNVVPPVDPKFGVELTPKLKPHVEGDEDTLTTEEILDAYFLNQVVMNQNAKFLSDPLIASSPLLRLEIQEQAMQLKDKFRSEVPEEVWKSSLEAIKKDHNLEEIRGQRYRSGKGGARTSLKKSIQTNLNINWGETIRSCLLLLFFGYFGGRNSFSRTVMIWGAPMCFIFQARPVKMWTKIVFYMLSNPPGIVASLLPAPQQAILNANIEKSFDALYRPEEASKDKTSMAPKESVAAVTAPAARKIEKASEEDEQEVEEEDEDESKGDEEEEEDSDDE